MDKWDERWCLVSCRPEHRTKTAMTEQCPHKDARGQYVVRSQGEWCFFDPPTRMQTNAWVSNKPEREARIMWLCHECGEIMPLAQYSPAAQRFRVPRLSGPQRKALTRVVRLIDEGHPPAFNTSERQGNRELSVTIRRQLESLGLIERFDYGATVPHATPPYIYFRPTDAGRDAMK